MIFQIALRAWSVFCWYTMIEKFFNWKSVCVLKKNFITLVYISKHSSTLWPDSSLTMTSIPTTRCTSLKWVSPSLDLIVTLFFPFALLGAEAIIGPSEGSCSVISEVQCHFHCSFSLLASHWPRWRWRKGHVRHRRYLWSQKRGC